MRSRQVLLVRLLPSEDEDVPAILRSAPLGTLGRVTAELSRFNTCTDGSSSIESFGVLYGPGFMVQLPMVGTNDPVSQVIVTMQEEDIAWPVLARICRNLGWKMMDPQSGRTFGA